MNKKFVYMLFVFVLMIATSVSAKVSNPCSNPGLSCVDAVKNSCLTGSISGGNAQVTNNAAASYNVGLAVYKVFDKDDHTQLEHQVLFDSDTGSVNKNSNLNLNVDLPGCQYQIDLFCGAVIEKFDQAKGIVYGDRKLDYYHKTTGNFCVQQFCGDGIKNGAEECDGTSGVGVHQICNSDCKLGTLPYCGDGIKNNGEQCDGTDGVGAHQSCNADCHLVNIPYCGDEIIGTNEQCDDGGNNGVACSPLCESSCNYCSNDCTTETNTGGSCQSYCDLHPTDTSCGGNPGVPVFPGITLGFAVIGAGLGLAMLRKQH